MRVAFYAPLKPPDHPVPSGDRRVAQLFLTALRAAGRRAAERAIRRADAVIGLNPADRECVLPFLRNTGRWVAFRPFIDAAAYSGQRCVRAGPPRLIAVAMMRYGDKLASYQILGGALSRLLDLPWSLEVIGDGPARRDVEDALSPFEARVTWAGEIGPGEIARRLASADLCVWPALNEAFGMALLEAQASGVPVIAGAAGGVSEIVVDGATGLLVPPSDAPAFARAVRSLLVDRPRRAAFSEAARQRVRAEHDISSAARRLNAVIDAVSRGS